MNRCIIVSRFLCWMNEKYARMQSLSLSPSLLGSGCHLVISLIWTLSYIWLVFSLVRMKEQNTMNTRA